MNPEVDGLTGKEYNYFDPQDQKLGAQMVNPFGFDEGPDDPGHGWGDTCEQIYGRILPGHQKGTPLMNGFALNARQANHTAYNPFSMFTPETAPIINTLAHQFAVFDQWHCSIPGPTDPNRAFAMSGTSRGVLHNFNGTLWDQESYFEFLGKRGIYWRAFYQDDPWAIMYYKDMHLKKNAPFISEFEDFFTRLENGDLAQFTWLQPRMTSQAGPPTWQHPDASVAEGERLIKRVYEALRGSRFWGDLAFFITYDEHGGFYDHVKPPQDGIPNPDGINAPNGFQFDRLGIRVPAVLVSPRVPAHTVVHKASGPTPTSQYDSTSVMATVNKIFGIKGYLGERMAWAGTFEHLFESTVREDCPMTLADIPPHSFQMLQKQRNLPLNDHLEIQVQFYCQQNGHGKDCGKEFKTQLEASKFIVREAQIFMDRIRNQP